MRALTRHRDNAHHRVHLVFASALSPGMFENTSWAQWKEIHAGGVHLEVAQVVLSPNAQSVDRPSLRLSLADLSRKVPRPQNTLACDLLVLFIPVESWLYKLNPSKRPVAATGEEGVQATVSEPATKRHRH